ncbi:MAG: helical membrane plugin domain-containing protein [Lacisediminihabitans sp.]
MSARAETAPPETGRSQAAEALVERLSEPRTVAALSELLDGIGTLSGLLTAAGSFLARGDEIMDNVAESYQELAQVATVGDSPLTGSLQRMMKLAGQALPVAERVADSDMLDKLANSALLDPAVFDLLVALARGVQQAQVSVVHEPGGHQPSMFQLAGAMKDPDVKRGISFALKVMKELGQTLGQPGSASRA